MKLGQLISGIKSLKIVNKEKISGMDIDDVTSDSKQVTHRSLFVAVRGFSSDGHKFLPEVIQKGCLAVVTEEEMKGAVNAVQIVVKDTRKILPILACEIFQHPSKEMVLVGVTGTNGKTTSTYILESIFKTAGFNAGVIGTVNYRYGGKSLAAPNTTPESTEFQKLLRQMKDGGVSHVVMEVSSHALKLNRVDGSHFNVGLFTNLTQDHLDFHGDFQDYFQSKERLFDELLAQTCKSAPASVINIDDPYGKELFDKLKKGNKTVLSYAIHKEANIQPKKFEFNLSGLKGEISTAQGSLTIHSPLLGEHNLYNILGVIGVSQALGISSKDIIQGIQNLKNVPGRLERVDVGQDFLVLVDYAHTDDALINVGKALTQLKKNRIITVFGCGGDRDRKKRPLMAKAASQFSDHVIVTSDNPRTEDPQKIIEDIVCGFKEINAKNFEVEVDRKKAIEKAIRRATRNDILLIAGKGHENYQILGKTKIHFDDREIATEAICSQQKK